MRAPKTGSERDVYLAYSLVNLLAQHVATCDTMGKDQLFAGDGEDPSHQNTVGYWWRKTLRDAGLSGIKLHDLRHFYASVLIAAGCDVVTVQRSLGHATATTTLNTYAHLWPTAEDAPARLRSRSCPHRSDTRKRPNLQTKCPAATHPESSPSRPLAAWPVPVDRRIWPRPRPVTH